MTRSTWMVGLGSLTPEQRRIVNLDTRSNHLIFGPAGSGKTLLLLHRAQRLMVQFKIPADRIRVLVYTNVLRSYIQSGITSVGLSIDVVQTFYTWVSALAKQMKVHAPSGTDANDRYLENLRAVLAHVKKERIQPILDIALVDEGQDLPQEAYQLLVCLCRHVTVFADYAQRIFDNGAHVSEIAKALGISKESTLLLKDLRNSRDVARVAAHFLPASDGERYLRSQSVIDLPGQRRIPVLFRGTNPMDEWDFLKTVVQQQVQQNRRVGILVPTRYLVYLVHKQLTERGIAVTKIERWQTDEVDFNELSPKVLTVHSAKGLTFDTVIIPQMVQRWYNQSKQAIAPLLFVGVTRARDWVCLCTTQGQEIPELAVLKPLIEEGVLFVQTPAAPRTGGDEPSSEPFDDVPL